VSRKTIGALVGFAVLGCGGEPSYVEYAEVCGQVGPFQVLELESGERLNGKPFKVGERVVFAVGRGTASESGEPAPSTIGKALWTTGPCGEAPKRVAKDVETAYAAPPWPGVLLGCDSAAGELLAIDPTGARPSHAVYTGLTGCNLYWTEHGMVSVLAPTEDVDGGVTGEPGLGTLQLYPYPADPFDEDDVSEPVVLLEAMRVTSREGLATEQQLRVYSAFALAITADDVLVRVELADGAMSRVQPGVAGFVADDVGRYLLWQDVTATDDNPNYPAGKLFLRDRNDSTDLFLGQGVLAFNGNALRYIDRGIIYLGLEAIRVFSVPDMGFHDLPDVGRIAALIGDHQWLMAGRGKLSLVDLVEDTTTILVRGSGDILRILADGVDLLEVPNCCQRSTLRAEGPLWFIPFAGEARKLAARASRWGHTFGDGRRAVMVDISGDWRGTLALTDPETGEALRIDDGVYVQVHAPKQVFGADVLVYSIPRGERAGVWLARAAPVADAME
jgi:hypothetical protein